MKRSILLALSLTVPACTQPVDEATSSTVDVPEAAQGVSYAPEDPHEPPEGYCRAFTTSFHVYSPQQLELDLGYCYDRSDFDAHQYVYAHGGISCGQLQHRQATYSNQTWHCGSAWYVWVAY